MKGLCRFARRWSAAQRGSYLPIFAVLSIPVLIAIGAAVDLSQAYVVKQRMTKALDAAGLAVGGMTGMSNAQLQTAAQNFFNANYPVSKLGIPGTVTVSTSGNIVSLTASGSLPTAVMGVVGVKSMDISVSSQITKMGKKLEVVLVLDNTGSMSSSSKLSTMKTAAKNLIDTVSAAAVNDGDVKVSLVPFTTDVNVGTGSKNASWLKWTWDLPTQTCVTTGSGSNKKTTCTQDTRTVSKSSWSGCVADRDESYDIAVTTPVTSNSATLYPANNDNTYNGSCDLESIVPLSTSWTSLKSSIDSMKAAGATNTTIGLVWGWNMVTQGATLSNAAAVNTEKLDKVIVFLTDGDNTYSRSGIGSCNGSSDCSMVDDRTTLLCTAIKNAGVKIYTIRLIDGNQTLLRNCATDTSMYYSVTSATQLTTVFNSIAQALSNLRVSQ